MTTLDPILCTGDENDDWILRGHLTAEECDAIVNGYDDSLRATGAPFHTWARRGIGTDEDGGQHSGYIYTGKRYAGQRGAFKVTAISVREVTG